MYLFWRQEQFLVEFVTVRKDLVLNDIFERSVIVPHFRINILHLFKATISPPY